MIYIIISLLLTHVFAFMVGGWVVMAHYEKERCNYENTNKKTNRTLLQKVQKGTKKRN
jgi:hypothetical protein